MYEHKDAQQNEQTLRGVEDTMQRTAADKDAKLPLSQSLTKSILDGDALLFHDQFHDGYIASQSDGTEVWRLRSKQFRTWLHYYAYTVCGRTLNQNAATEITYTLEGHALHEGPLYHLSVRVASYDGALWYDLGRQAVRITKDGWEVIESPPILFRRYNHQEKQVIPEHDRSLRVVELVLPPSMTEAQKLLFTVSLVTGLIPNIPQTIDVIFGDHGSAKSTLTKIKKALLDPSVLDELSPPTSLNEFIQLLAHHWYLPLGNLTRLPGWMSAW